MHRTTRKYSTMSYTKPKSNRNPKSLHPSTMDTSKQSVSATTLSENIGEEEAEQSCKESMSRTSFAILDYYQFKAARKIQAVVRGWLARVKYLRKRCAAIIIQREWRRYQAQRNYYRLLEQRVQKVIDEYHSNAAVRIQAYWRGFLVREHIHDQYRMKRSQRMAAEDLLNCIAYKLHYLLRTYQIPGIYSLRNSHVLSKVEKLLISISFKQGNKRTFTSRLQREFDFQESRKIHNESAFGTKIPYAGPNFSGVCDPKCNPVYKEHNIDARMHQILRKYESEQLRQQSKSHQKCFTKKHVPGIAKIKKIKEPSDFCSDVIGSMRRWNIIAPHKFQVRPDVFKKPENVEKFLTEIESMYDFMYSNCKCNVKSQDLST